MNGFCTHQHKGHRQLLRHNTGVTSRRVAQRQSEGTKDGVLDAMLSSALYNHKYLFEARFQLPQ